ncbi:hypothetical protein LXL04_010094 [Taraxacum kok-saghyz]
MVVVGIGNGSDMAARPVINNASDDFILRLFDYGSRHVQVAIAKGVYTGNGGGSMLGSMLSSLLVRGIVVKRGCGRVNMFVENNENELSIGLNLVLNPIAVTAKALVAKGKAHLPSSCSATTCNTNNKFEGAFPIFFSLTLMEP